MNELQALIKAKNFSAAYILVEKLKKGDPIVNPDNEFPNPLISACIWNSFPLISSLIEKGADINVKSTTDKRTALLYAILNKNENTANLLLRNGANPDLSDDHGNIPLVNALEGKNTRLALNLIKKDANPDVLNRQGVSPLMLTCVYNFNDILEILLKKGANPDIRNHNAQSPIFFAQDKKQVELLIEYGADLYKQDKFGNTPLESAAEDSMKYKIIKAELVKRAWKIEQKLTKKGISKVKQASKNIPKITGSKKI